MGYSLAPEREIDFLSKLSQIEKGVEIAGSLGEYAIVKRLAIKARDITLREYHSFIKESEERMENIRRFAQKILQIYSSVGHPQKLSPANMIEVRELKKSVKKLYKCHLRIVDDTQSLKEISDNLTKILEEG